MSVGLDEKLIKENCPEGKNETGQEIAGKT